MSALTFHSADQYTVAQLSALFTEVYSGYFVPVQVDAAAFQSMVATQDIDLSASQVALLDGETVAIALLSVRVQRGWVGGMGVVPAQRGKGIGREVMLKLIESARARGLRSITLEVIVDNAFASRIYKDLGFRVTRTLDIWTRDFDATFPMPPRHNIETLGVDACLTKFDEWRNVPSPWQRDILSLEHDATSLEALGVVEDGRIQAYVLYRMQDASVHIVDMATAPGQRTQWIESTLRKLIYDRSGSEIRVVNLPQDDPASMAMQHIGAHIQLQQHEMKLDL